MKQLGEFVTSLTIGIAGIFLRGWTLSVLWTWLIVPLFNVQNYGVTHFVVASLIFSLFSLNSSRVRNEVIENEGKPKVDFKKKLFVGTAIIIGSNAMALFIGYVISILIK